MYIVLNTKPGFIYTVPNAKPSVELFFCLFPFLFSASPIPCVPNSRLCLWMVLYYAWCYLAPVFYWNWAWKVVFNVLSPAAGTGGQDRWEGAPLQGLACWQSCAAPTAGLAGLQRRSTLKCSRLSYCCCWALSFLVLLIRPCRNNEEALESFVVIKEWSD